MRRRIYIAPDGSGLEDVTDQLVDEVPDHGTLKRVEDGAGGLIRRPDGIIVERAEGQLTIEAVAVRPYDEIECLAAEEALAVLDGTADRVVVHARDLHGNGDAPR